MHIKPLFRQHLAKNQRENNIRISRNGIVWLKPQSAIRPHITLSILCIDALSLSYCFYWRLFFLDIAHYACEKYNENPLNIKQKYIPNPYD